MPGTPEADQWKRLFAYVNGGMTDHHERSWDYCGLDVWPIVKAQILTRGSNIFNAGRQASLSKERTPTTVRVGDIFSRWVSAVRPKSPLMPQKVSKISTFDWPDLPLPDPSPDILCLGYATNHKKLGDSYFQLCMDPLRSALAQAGYSSMCLINGLGEGHEGVRQAAATGVYGIEEQFRSVRRLAEKMPPVGLTTMPGFKQWWRRLSEVLGGDMFITVEHIETVIRQSAVVGAWMHDHLSRLRPKAVLISAYYGLIGHGGSWACRQLGIPIADVQHGVAGENHHAYSWPNAPRSGFNTLPTAFLTWSHRECEEMSRTSLEWKPVMIPVGNVWRLLDETVRTRDEAGKIFTHRALAAAQSRVRREHLKITELKSRSPGELDILLALHPEERLPWLPRLKTLAPKTWRFWVRLHPGEFKNDGALAERLREVVDERTFVIEPSLAPLNVILSEVDVVLTKYSSVALDAKAYGVPTVAYSDAARSFFGNPELHRVSYVAPLAEDLNAALNRRMSIYRSTEKMIQPIPPLNQLGETILEGLSLPQKDGEQALLLYSA